MGRGNIFDSETDVSVNEKVVSPKRSGFISRLFKRPTKILLEDLVEEGADTDVMEVWFSGCHSGELISLLNFLMFSCSFI